MKNEHKNLVKAVADELVLTGLVGRADHIGAHPFLFLIIQFQKFKKFRIHKKMLVGGFRSVQSVF